MKRIFLFYIMAIMAISMSAQNDVTTFLGIPVDGFKSEMKQKLVSKGFVPKKVGTNEFLEGEFNGTDVHVYIATNNNKVYRIMLCDANTQNEANIKIRFNKLVSQFENNKRYTSLDKYTLSDEENISYEMTVNKKNYDALFSSNPQPIGFSGILLAKRQNSFYCTYFLHNRNVADTKSPYPIKRLEVIRWFNQKSMVFNQSLS